MRFYQYHIYPTMKCSMLCRHCFIDEEVRKEKKVMTVDEFKTVVDKLSKHFKESDAEIADITIMGGEPIAISPDFYLEVMPYLIQKFTETKKIFQTRIMTNLLHYSNLNKISHLFDLVITSYEPKRFSIENLASNIERKKNIWERNFKNYIQSGRDFSISITTTKDVIDAGEDLLEDFYNKGIKFIQLNLVTPEGSILSNDLGKDYYEKHSKYRLDELSIPLRNRTIITKDNLHIIEDYDREAEYFIKITEWFYKKIKSGANISVSPIQSFIRSILKGEIIDDTSCCIDKGLCVRTDGKVSGCAAEIGNENMLSYGNLFTDSVDDIFNSTIKFNHLFMGKRLDKICLSCEFLKNCYGSCMLRSRFWDKTDPKKSCHGLKPYLTYINNNIDRLKEIV